MVNTSKKRVLAQDAEERDTFLGNGLGLMFRKRQSMILSFPSEGIRALHMWFVFFPIDVLFLDKSQKVVEIKENFVPWSVYFPRKKARYVVEIPKGWTKKSKTDIGDRIVFRQGNI